MKANFSKFFQSFSVLRPYLFSTDPKYRESTEEYPDFVSSRLKTGSSAVSRGFLRNDLRTCTGCDDCRKVCPSTAIQMDSTISEDGSVKVSSFEIDFAKCVFCGVCVDICPVRSISHTTEYEIAAATREEMIITFSQRDNDLLNKQEAIKQKIKQIRSYEVRR